MGPLRRPPRTRRAAILFFFLLVGLPMCWLAGALSVDYARVIHTHRAAAQTADAAALAGALQFQRNNPSNPNAASNRIDVTRARSVAQDLVTRTKNIKGGSWQIDRVVVVVQQPSGSRPGTVTVTIDYRVTDLVFMQLAGNYNSSYRVQRGSVTRSAIVCDDGQAPTYQRSCARPTRNF